MFCWRFRIRECYRLQFQNPLLHILHHRVLEQGCCILWSWFVHLHHIRQSTRSNFQIRSSLHQLKRIILPSAIEYVLLDHSLVNIFRHENPLLVTEQSWRYPFKFNDRWMSLSQKTFLQKNKFLQWGSSWRQLLVAWGRTKNFVISIHIWLFYDFLRKTSPQKILPVNWACNRGLFTVLLGNLDMGQCYRLEFQSPLLHSLHHRVLEQGCCILWSCFVHLHHIQQSSLTNFRIRSSLHQLKIRISPSAIERIFLKYS